MGVALPINKNVLPYGAEGIEFPFVNDYTWIFGVDSPRASLQEGLPDRQLSLRLDPNG
jgi:hypothetical protein